MEEIWKDIENYKGYYQVSNLGNVRRIKIWCGNKNCSKFKNGIKLLKKKISKKPDYYYANLTKNSKAKTHRIHRLVAQAFIPNPNNYPQVNHIDGNKLNNNVNNLEWCNNTYNIQEAIRIGLWKKRNDKIRKKVIQYDKENNIINEYNSLIEAEIKTGVRNGNISQCCKGKRKSAGGYIWKYKQ